MGQFSRLTAVNRILRGSSENPVTELTPTTTNETFMAEQILDNTNLMIQMSGLHSNTVTKELTPNGSSHILLPTTALAGVAWFLPDGGKNSLDKNVTLRESGSEVRLYDMKADVDTFTDTVVVKYSILLDFTTLLTAIQFWIIDEAAAVYQMATQGDPAMNQLLQAQAMHSRILGRAADMRSIPHNAFYNGRSNGPRQLGLIPRSWR